MGMLTMARSKTIVFIISLLCTGKAFSQRPPTSLWLSTQLPVELNNKWLLLNDASYRTLGNSITPLQYLYRTGLRYNVTTHWAAAAGVAFFYTRTTFSKQQDEFTREFRIWEDVTYKTDMAKHLQSASRFRVEERSYAASSIAKAYHATRYRLRTQLQENITSQWGIQLSEEYMQQYAHKNLSFDQNRLGIGAVYSFTPKAKLTAGYTWELRPQHVSQHILNFNFQKTISLHG